MMNEIIMLVVPSHWDGITLSWLPALIAAGGSILGSLFGGLFSSKNQNKNLQATRETNATNLQIHREDNAFNAQQSDQAWQRTQQMFHMENAYNSPMQQLQRMQAAGLNPAVAMGNAAPSQAQGASPAPPSSAAPPTMLPATIDPTLGPWQSIAQIMPQLGKIAGEAFDAQYLGMSLNDRLRQLNLDANTQQYTLEVLLPLEGKLKRKQIEQVAQAIKESESLVEKYKAEQSHTEEDIKRIQEQVKDIFAGMQLKGKQKELLQKQINSYEKELNARLKNLAAQTRNTNADTEGKKKDNEIKDRQKELMDMDVKTRKATLSDEISRLKKSSKITDAQYDHLKELIEKAEKENSVFYWNFVIDKVTGAVGKAIPFRP